MDNNQRPDDLVETLYEASVKPDRLFDLIEQWDARISGSDPELAVRLGGFSAASFVRHVERALEILDELGAFEFRRLDDLLAGMPTAAMVLTDTGVVVAANEPARAAFGLYPGSSIRLMPLETAELDDLANRVAAVALGPKLHDVVVQLHPEGRERPLLLHLRTVDGGRMRRHALAVSTEHVWHDEAGGVLSRVFALTGAEIALVRALAAGDTVRDISRATGRTVGTVRSQLHSILGKTNTRSQGELARLAAMLLQAVAFDPGQTSPARDAGALVQDRRRGHVRLADGRKMAVLQFGDPAGRTVLWLQDAMGFFHPTRSAERELFRRKLRIVVPIRAGYGTSDVAPRDRDILEVALEDLSELLGQAGIAHCPVVASEFGIRLALMLARAAPQRVERIVGVGCAFPILNMKQFRRLHPTGRAFQASVRFAPHMLQFFVRATLSRILRTGVEEFMRGMFRQELADARAIADREVAEAITAGFTFLHSDVARTQATFCGEMISFQPGVAA